MFKVTTKTPERRQQVVSEHLISKQLLNLAKKRLNQEQWPGGVLSKKIPEKCLKIHKKRLAVESLF